MRDTLDTGIRCALRCSRPLPPERNDAGDFTAARNGRKANRVGASDHLAVANALSRLAGVSEYAPTVIEATRRSFSLIETSQNLQKHVAGFFRRCGLTQ